MYEDKLDEKITSAFYDSHEKQYSSELKDIAKAISKHTNANVKYYELGTKLYELSQKATTIYEKAKKEDKRLLINLVFSELYLKDNKLIANYSRPFTLLSELVALTNGTKMEKNKRIVARIFE